jgi:hypothetical protein
MHRYLLKGDPPRHLRRLVVETRRLILFRRPNVNYIIGISARLRYGLMKARRVAAAKRLHGDDEKHYPMRSKGKAFRERDLNHVRSVIATQNISLLCV